MWDGRLVPCHKCVTNVSQIVLKPAYFGLMVLKRNAMENTEIPGENREYKVG